MDSYFESAAAYLLGQKKRLLLVYPAYSTRQGVLGVGLDQGRLVLSCLIFLFLFPSFGFGIVKHLNDGRLKLNRRGE